MDGGFGDIKHDYRAAQLCSLTANMNRSKKQKPYKLEDFLMRPKRKRSVDHGAIIRNFEMLSKIGKKDGKKK